MQIDHRVTSTRLNTFINDRQNPYIMAASGGACHSLLWSGGSVTQSSFKRNTNEKREREKKPPDRLTNVMMMTKDDGDGDGDIGDGGVEVMVSEGW